MREGTGEGWGQSQPEQPQEQPQEQLGGYHHGHRHGDPQGRRQDRPPDRPPGWPAGHQATAPVSFGYGYGWAPPRPLAGWGQRLAAYLLDVLLVLLVALVPGFAVIIPVLATAASGADPAADPPAWAIVVVLLAVAYMVVVQLAGYLWYMGWRQGATGSTVGKRALGIRLADMRTGQPVGGTRGLGRAALRLLLSSAAISIVSFLWPLWDAKCQTWEDMAFKTIVVRDPRD